MRILISGVGIAGLTCAYWLHRDGHTPVLVERARHGRGAGSGFDFHGAGYALADRMGILERLREYQLRARDVVHVDRAGAVTARLSQELIRGVVGSQYLALMHDGLEHALTQAVAPDVEIRYGNSIAAIEQRADRVDVRFADGTEDGFELLIGADGVHSATRSMVFGPEPNFARPLGYTIASHPVTEHAELGPVRAHYTEAGRQLVTYPTNRVGERMALYLFADSAGAGVPREQRLERLNTAFAGMDWVTQRLLAEAPESERIFMDGITQIEMPHWHRGRVVLLGDACACMTLVSGQGVGLAMAGAYRLAEALRVHGDYRRAFERYQAGLREQVRERQRAARLFARALVPRTELGVAASRVLHRLLLRQAFAPILRPRFASMDLLTEY